MLALSEALTDTLRLQSGDCLLPRRPDNPADDAASKYRAWAHEPSQFVAFAKAPRVRNRNIDDATMHFSREKYLLGAVCWVVKNARIRASGFDKFMMKTVGKSAPFANV